MIKLIFLYIMLLVSSQRIAQNFDNCSTLPSEKQKWKPPIMKTGDYPVVWICCNPWMTKNLDVNTYRNGDPIPKVTNNSDWSALTTGAYCYYNNDSTTYAAIYGKLYNWYAINDPRGLAPEGWHISSDLEWTTLNDCLGGAAGLMKEVGTTHWLKPNTDATNLSSFTALPGGYRLSDGSFNLINSAGYWWSDVAEVFHKVCQLQYSIHPSNAQT